MVLSGPVKWVQCVLIVLNFLVMAAGIASIGMGIWSMTDEYGSERMSVLTDSHFFRLQSILSIACGVSNFIIAIFGVRCILGETKRLIIAHSIAMTLVFLFFVIVAAIGLVNSASNLREKLSEQMAKTLTEKYNVGSSNQKITDQWDTIQEELECCGVEGNVSEGKSWFLWQSSRWFRKQKPTIMYVPESCCNKNDFLFRCEVFRNMTGEAARRSYSDFIEMHPALFTRGCLGKFIDRVQTRYRYVACVFMAMLTLLILCGLFSYVLIAIIINREKHQVECTLPAGNN